MLTPEQRAHIAKFKIPVDSLSPSRYWIVCLDEYSNIMPTDEELKQIQSYCEFKIRSFFNETYQAKLLAMDLPIDSGYNTTIFRKGWLEPEQNQAWFFRKSTWQVGPLFVPSVTHKDYRNHTFIEVVDRIETLFPEKWKKWKQEHPDIFPSTQV